METTNGKDELKTNFVTREGVYRLLNLSEYSRPNRVGYQSNQNSPQVRVSLVSLPQSAGTTSQNYPSTNATQQQQQLEKGESFFLPAPPTKSSKSNYVLFISITRVINDDHRQQQQ